MRTQTEQRGVETGGLSSLLVQPLVSRGPREGRPGPHPKGSWSPGQRLSVQQRSPWAGASCWSGSGFHVTEGFQPRPPMFSLYCGTRLRSRPGPRGGGQAPSGPRRWMGWARLAGPAGNKAEGPLRPKETPGSPRPVRVPSELQNPSPPGSAPSGLPPAQESQRRPEQAPRFTSGGIFSQFSLLTFSTAVSINGSVLIITGPGLGRLQSPN